jgi:O-antigen/teichoic acid export membrane protein
MGTINIGRKDVIWNYIATFLKVGAGVLLLPLILRLLPTEEVAIWTVFTTITGAVVVLDFGFNPSFTRNITYIFSGINKLQPQGIVTREKKEDNINYVLLKETIFTMRWFYKRIAIVLFFLLVIIGTFYLSSILATYPGNKQEVYIAWTILCLINPYSMYTSYYDALMTGGGLIKISKQIVIIGYVTYLLLATGFLFIGWGLIAIITAQASSVIIIRLLSHKNFFTRALKEKLGEMKNINHKGVIKVIYPNAIKAGITSVGNMLMYRSPLLIGSIYLPLSSTASFGITRQIFELIMTAATLYSTTYIPKFSSLWTENNKENIKLIFRRGLLISISVFILCSVIVIVEGNYFLQLIRSDTVLLPTPCLVIFAISFFLTAIHAQSAAIISAANHILLYLAGLIGGFFVVILIFVFLKYTTLGVMGMALAPAIVYLAFENWVWPLKAFKMLKNHH